MKQTACMSSAFAPDVTLLQPIIKWPGGKERELDKIIPALPARINNYYEPFVGGGSVFTSVCAERYFINDLSAELIALYRNIASQNKLFFAYVEAISLSWARAGDFHKANISLADLYKDYRDDRISRDRLGAELHDFCTNKREGIMEIVPCIARRNVSMLIDEMETALLRKTMRMRALEATRHLLSDTDLSANVETAIKGALYMYYRHLYNDKIIMKEDAEFYCALFFFIRNYCYSSMFRYNKAGEFNVPYGGMAYNHKSLNTKIEYYKSCPLARLMNRTSIYNMDFEQFLRQMRMDDGDFVFLDPPYDSEFSTYDKMPFGKADHVRLANAIINDCKAKWMLVIKHTEFIYNLYDKQGINIRSFDKDYAVSFMNRNNRKATHLVITNY